MIKGDPLDDEGDEGRREAAVDNRSSDAAAAAAERRESRKVARLLLIPMLLVIVLAVTFSLVLNDDDDEVEEKLLCCAAPDDSGGGTSNENTTQAPYDNTTQVPYDWDCSEVANVTSLYDASVSGMAELLEDHKAPPGHLTDMNPTLQDGDFNVSLYFDVLEYLSLPEGTVLEYVYIFNGMGGYPLLYLRNQTDEPFATAADLMLAKDCSSSPWTCPNYLNDIMVHNSPQAFLQFVILDVKGDQFYLFWHDAVNDYEIITSSASVEEILQRHPPCQAGDDWGCFGTDFFEMARSLDVAPTIQCDDDTVRVGVVLFTDWGGFVQRTYNISRAAGVGDRIVDREQEVLVPFDIGIVF